MGLRFLFTQTDHEDQIWGSDGSDFALRMRDQVLASGTDEYEITDDPDRADIILFWEPHQDSQVIWAPRLRAHPLIHEFPHKAFVVWLDDAPLGFLPGLYTSLPKRLFHEARHRTWIYYRLQNPFVHTVGKEQRDVVPQYLASFRGSNRHHVRRWLLKRKEPFAPEGIILTQTKHAQFCANPSAPELEPEQRAYVETILDSKFSLCPRGNGAGSFRLQESMALGRAPVIISDDWVPVIGPQWDEFAIFVREDDIRHLPRILRDHEERWKEMGDKAREAYETWFLPEQYAVHALDQIAALYRSREHDERAYIAQWDDMIAAAWKFLGITPSAK